MLLLSFSVLCCVVFCGLITFVLCLVCSMLPVSLDCPFLVTPLVFSNVYSMSNCIVKSNHINDLSGQVSSQEIHYIDNNRVFGDVIVYFLLIFCVVLFILFVLVLCFVTNVSRGSEISIFANSFVVP